MPFSEKAALTAPIEGTSGFAGKYARRPARAVLPDLDLDRRPFKPPCSHLIDSEVFDGLPGPMKSEVDRHLREILTRREAGPGPVRMLTGCAEVREDVPRQPEFGPSERPARPRGCRESVRFAVTQDGREPWEQAMSFRGVFIAIFLGTALVVAAFLVNSRRPRVEFAQPTAALVRASGKCAECHRQETSAIVHEFEMSRHNEKGVNCLDCHQPAAGQDKMDHRGFVINAKVTAANCSGCHQTQYDQFLRSRHAAPAWASVTGKRDLSVEQIAFSEKYQPGGTDRPPHPVALGMAPTTRAEDKPEGGPLKVVAHVNFPESGVQGAGLKNVANILKEAPDTQVEVVVGCCGRTGGEGRVTACRPTAVKARPVRTPRRVDRCC